MEYMPWYAIGIGGTIAFMAIWIITRMPGNPITGRGGAAGNPIDFSNTHPDFINSIKRCSFQDKMSSSRIQKGMILVLALLLVAVFPTVVLTHGNNIQLALAQNANQTFGPPPPGQFSATQANASTNETCTLTPSLIEVEGTPQQTEGPYFVDNMPNRSDITSDTSDESVQQGVPLKLVINVYDVDGDSGSCIPLKGAQVDIWHANPQGIYSGIQQQGTSGQNFLRGNQVTDDNGTVRFATVYPGWYEGRAIHIHVKVRTFESSNETFEWTSQFYLNNSITEQVHTQPPYSDHGQPDMINEQDGIYTGASTDGLIQSNAGQHLMLNMTQEQEDQGYLGTFNVVVNANQTG
jgi:protocatechuate 3,4-dioxygenase beta subunit